MNKKAESFQAYLKEKNLSAFTVDEIKDDPFHTVVFRSQLNIDGNNLPTIVIADDSIYSMIRILVAPKVPEGSEGLAKLLNTYNQTFKAFKYYVDNKGSLILDISIVSADESLNGDLVYALFQTVIEHLNESYKNIMKEIWK
ncbi:YbjN domain-containing protein [Megasphaera stantonii]|uniref:YbjN domain-containing protein n=1 Tax=Megasphaera stantonii TaxID=2144175 RepID=A0A346AZJ5_9FIRM|nr:YbjN domain-containing protein [Megasphaera stantonii]AXL21288.1 hypothetical protein DKB62_06790 [Megasphaera stantonii]